MNARQLAIEQRDGVQRDADQSAFSPMEDRSGKGALWEPRDELSRLPTRSEKPGAFWAELAATLGEFVEVVRVSRERMDKLSAQIAERDGIISALRTEKATLEARLRITGGAPSVTIAALPSSAANEAGALADPAPAAPAKDIGIWRRLTRLERE